MRKFLATLAFALAFIANAQAQNNKQVAAGSGPSTEVTTTPAVAEIKWEAVSSLVTTVGCRTARHVYTFKLVDDNLFISSDLGTRDEKATVTNGSVDHSFYSPSGSYMNVSGNVRTKEMSATNVGAACRWNLIPR